MAAAAEAVADQLAVLSVNTEPRGSSEDGKQPEAPANVTPAPVPALAAETGPEPGGDAAVSAPVSAADGAVAPAAASVYLPMPDTALLVALMPDNRERTLVLRLEQDVLAFLDDASRDLLEMPTDLSNYQRMLAHKVAQYHGLQTSTADYEANQCRVIAHRSAVMRGGGDKNPGKPRLCDLDMSAGSPYSAAAAKGAHSWSEAPKLLRRPMRHDRPPGAYSDAHSTAGSVRSMRDREDDYDKARARIFSGDPNAYNGGPGVPMSAPGTAPVMGGYGPARGMGRGGPGFVPGGRGGRRGPGGRGDRSDGMSEQDYMRGGMQPGMPRAGAYGHAGGMIPVYEGQPMMMVPAHPHQPGMPAMYAMHGPQGEMAWSPNGGMGMYMAAAPRPAPPPPPPSTSSNASSGYKPGGSGGNNTGTWVAAGANNSSSASTPAMGNHTGAGATGSAGVQAGQGGSSGAPPPPPPPPPQGASRPYAMPGVMSSPMAAYGHPQAPAGSPMAVYSPGPIPGMPAGAMVYAMPGGYAGFAGYVPAMGPDGTPIAMAHPGGYPTAMPAGAYATHGAMMAAQGYPAPHPGAAYIATPTVGASPGAPGTPAGGPHGMPARPPTMAYAPMPMGYAHAVPYPIQAMQPGAAAAMAQQYGGYQPHPGAAPAHTGGYGQGGGGRGRGRGYNSQQQSSHPPPPGGQPANGGQQRAGGPVASTAAAGAQVEAS